MRFVTGECQQRTSVRMALQEVLLQGFESARGPTLGLLHVPHCAIRTDSCHLLADLVGIVGFQFRSIVVDPASELVPGPLAFPLPAVEQPTLQSVINVAD